MLSVNYAKCLSPKSTGLLIRKWFIQLSARKRKFVSWQKSAVRSTRESILHFTSRFIATFSNILAFDFCLLFSSSTYLVIVYILSFLELFFCFERWDRKQSKPQCKVNRYKSLETGLSWKFFAFPMRITSNIGTECSPHYIGKRYGMLLAFPCSHYFKYVLEEFCTGYTNQGDRAL